MAVPGRRRRGSWWRCRRKGPPALRQPGRAGETNPVTDVRPLPVGGPGLQLYLAGEPLGVTIWLDPHGRITRQQTVSIGHLITDTYTTPDPPAARRRLGRNPYRARNRHVEAAPRVNSSIYPSGCGLARLAAPNLRRRPPPLHDAGHQRLQASHPSQALVATPSKV